MKVRFFAVAAALLFAAGLSSCTSENLNPEESKAASYPRVITVNMGNDTRVALDNTNRPVFEKFQGTTADSNWKGDYLNVYSYDEEGYPLSAVYLCTDPEKGEFTLDDGNYGWGDEAPVGPYMVLYNPHMPGSVNPMAMELMVDQICYDLDLGSKGLDQALMAAKCEDPTNVTLKNVMALLKITIPSWVEFIGVELRAEMLSYAVYNVENCLWSYPNTETNDSVMCYGDMTNTSEQYLEPGVYYFPIIPQTVSSLKLRTISYTYYEEDDEYYDVFYEDEWGEAENVTFEAGKIYDLGLLGIDF